MPVPSEFRTVTRSWVIDIPCCPLGPLNCATLLHFPIGNRHRLTNTCTGVMGLSVLKTWLFQNLTDLCSFLEDICSGQPGGASHCQHQGCPHSPDGGTSHNRYWLVHTTDPRASQFSDCEHFWPRERCLVQNPWKCSSSIQCCFLLSWYSTAGHSPTLYCCGCLGNHRVTVAIVTTLAHREVTYWEHKTPNLI